ncbi:MAG: glutaredoxin family protein [Sedimentibacter sp.]
MKKVTMFYLENCPHCSRAFNMIEELKSKNQNYSNIEIECIEESKNVQVASAQDYYYVPSFFVDGEKLHEGVPTMDKIQAVLEKAIK